MVEGPHMASRSHAVRVPVFGTVPARRGLPEERWTAPACLSRFPRRAGGGRAWFAEGPGLGLAACTNRSICNVRVRKKKKKN